MYINKLIKRLKSNFLLKIAVSIHNVDAIVSKRTLPAFGTTPKNLTIELPRKFINPQRIHIGDNVSLGPNSFLYAHTEYPTSWMQHPTIRQTQQHFDSSIIIGNNVTATASLQISAQRQIVIEDDVMFASNIHVNDALHGFETAAVPYKYQKIFSIDPIRIEKGCWIGQNVVILPGVTIGENSIIGANSVVNKNIPSKSIAAGTPAKIIKKWDDTTNSWSHVIDDH